MRVVSSSSLLFTSLVVSSASLPSLAAPVRGRRASIYERQEVDSPSLAAFDSSASISNLAGLVAPPTTPALGARDSHIFGDFQHDFEGIINALDVSASSAPVFTSSKSKKPFPSSLSKLSQSTTPAPSSSAASSTSTSASASASASVLPRDHFLDGLIGALSAPAQASSTPAPPPPPSNTPVLPSESLAPTSKGSSAMPTPTLPPQPTNTPVLPASSIGARNMIDDFIGALDVSASSQATSAPTSASASVTASSASSTVSTQSILARNGYSGGMLDGLMGRGIDNTASAPASPTPSLDTRGDGDIIGELIGELGLLGGHAHSATSSQAMSSPALPMTSPTLGARDRVLDGLIGALDVTATSVTMTGLGIMSGMPSSASATDAPITGLGITSGMSSSASATGAPMQTMA